MMVDHVQQGRQSKSKGNAWENETAHWWTNWWYTGEEFHRMPSSGAIHWLGRQGDVIPDVANKQFPFLIENKNYSDWTLENFWRGNKEFPIWWSQAVREAESTNMIPLLFLKRARITPSPYVLMPFVPEVAELFTTNYLATATQELEFTSEVDGYLYKSYVLGCLQRDLEQLDPQEFERSFTFMKKPVAIRKNGQDVHEAPNVEAIMAEFMNTEDN